MRIYKGCDVDISVPFNASGISSFSAIYFTNGTTKIDRNISEVIISANTLTSHFENTDLDLLDDGVVRYKFNYQVEGIDFVQSCNTPYFLKTANGYSAQTKSVVWNDGYVSGYTDGAVSGAGYSAGYISGHTDGLAEQKAKLIATAITLNGNYSREDGYNSISVNISQTGHTDQELIDAFNSGHTSGKTDGIAEQKEKLISTAITANGTFTREDGWNQLTINVPSGFTPTGTKSISANGIYDITNFANVNVEVPFSGVSGTLVISANGAYDVSQYAYVSAQFNYEETFKAVKVKQGSKFVFKEEVVGNYQISPVSKYDFSEITDGTDLFKGFQSDYLFFTPQINNTTNGTSMFENSAIGYLSGDFSAITNATRMFKNSNVRDNTSLHYMQPITATSMFEGAYIDILQMDFSKITISTDMWKNSNIEYRICPSAINCSMDFSTTYFYNKTYDIIKDILECAKLTENSNSKQLLFNHTIIDTGGHIQDLINECEQKGWSIDGLHLN